ncbi:hypothetical protein HW555_005247 [Spodoptera exigua]|uniref:Uncharacterized protein n=1 Tax=Spodoptera exigua TaxID=7107 RepID=A0A835GKX2_SPOEX|nr:hypothetical protein HW555_005247 [Spodoptera exigua]
MNHTIALSLLSLIPILSFQPRPATNTSPPRIPHRRRSRRCVAWPSVLKVIRRGPHVDLPKKYQNLKNE